MFNFLMFFIKPENLVGDTRTNERTTEHFNGANPSSKNLEIFFIRVYVPPAFIGSFMLASFMYYSPKVGNWPQ